jgi:hypothetical protein
VTVVHHNNALFQGSNKQKAIWKSEEKIYWTLGLHIHTYFLFVSQIKRQNSSLFNEFVCKLSFFWHEWSSLKREWNERFKGPRAPKKVQSTHERVEYNVFLFDEPFKGSKSLKIFKISLTFRFDKLTFIKIRSHRRKFPNSDSVEQKVIFPIPTGCPKIRETT